MTSGINPSDGLGRSPMDGIDFAENKEQRCPVLLLCDTSGSMSGDPISDLNSAIRQFREEVSEDDIASLRVEMAIVSFESFVTTQHPFARMEYLDPPVLQPGGGTNLAQGIQTAVQMLESRKEEYRKEGIPYYRPILVLMTDGLSTSTPSDSASARDLLARHERDNRLICFKVGVGREGADALNQLLEPGQYPPLEMDKTKYSEFFKWLSASVQNVSRSSGDGAVQLAPTDPWRVITP